MTKFVLSRTNLIPRLFKSILITIAAVLAVACSSSKSTSTLTSTPSSIPGGEAFEGTVTAKLFGGQRESQMKFAVKGDLTRIETSAVDGNDAIMGVIIMDLKSAQQTMLMPAQKTYMTMNFKEMGEKLGRLSGETSGHENESGKMPKLTPTGKQETIAGYSCEHWLVGDDQTIDLCIAKGLGYFGFGNSSQSGGPLKALKDLTLDPRISTQIESSPEMKRFVEGGAFPLKISRVENGQSKSIMEVTGIDRKKLDDSLFTVPPDFKKMEIPGMPVGNR